MLYGIRATARIIGNINRYFHKALIKLEVTVYTETLDPLVMRTVDHFCYFV